MNLKCLLILTVFIITGLISCTKETTNQYNPGEITKGKLLIWTSVPSDFTTCGPTLQVKLSNGQEAVITNYYATPPTSCQGDFGGYFPSLDEGSYTYTITSVDTCIGLSGTVSVAAGKCNVLKLH